MTQGELSAPVTLAVLGAALAAAVGVAAATGIAIAGILAGSFLCGAIAALVERPPWTPSLPPLPGWVFLALSCLVFVAVGGVDALIEDRGTGAIWRAAVGDALFTLTALWPTVSEADEGADEMPAAVRREFAGRI